MKKFLSMLLCVMMVLSNVSFAIPSAIGAMDSAFENVNDVPAPIDDTPLDAENTADLSASTVEVHPQHGDAMFKVHFNNTTTGTAYNNEWAWVWEMYGDSSTAPNRGASADTTHGTVIGNGFNLNHGYNGVVVEADGSNDNTKYMSATMPFTGDTLFRIAMDGGSKTNTTQMAKEGTYTVTLDARVDANAKLGSTDNNMIRVYQSSDYKDYKFSEKFVADGQWHTYVATFSIPTDRTHVNDLEVYGHYLKGGEGKVDLDNLTIYYKPSTATVSFTAGGKDLGEASVSTAGVTLSALAKDVVPAGKVATSAKIDGKTYTSADTIILGGDCDVELTLENDPWAHANYGTMLVNMDFEGALDTDNSMTYWEDVEHIGASVNPLINRPDQIKTNFSSSSVNSNGTPYVISDFVKTEGGNTYFETTLVSNWTQFMWGRNLGSSWDAIVDTASVENGLFDEGIYTYVMDIKLSDTTLSGGADNFRTGGNVRTDGTATIASNTSGEWATHTFMVDTTAGTTHTDSNGASVAGRAVELVGPSLNTAAATGTLAWDNARLYIKPATVNVDVYDGNKFISTKTGVTTKGISVSDFVAEFASYKVSKVVSGVKFNGETLGLNDTLTFGYNTDVELVLTDKPNYDKVNGTPFFTFKFDNATKTTHAGSWIAAEGSPAEYGVEIYDSTWYAGSGNVVLGLTGNIVEEAGRGKVLSGNLPLASADTLVSLATHAGQSVTSKAGVYTLVYDAKLNVTSSYSSGTTGTDVTGFSRFDNKYFVLANDNAWHTYSLPIVLESDFTGDMRITNYQTGIAKNSGATGTIAIDNISVFYKSATTDVTIYAGDEVAAEKTGVATSGIAVSDLLSGIAYANYAKNIVGIIYEGKEYALTDTVVLGEQAEVELVLVDNPDYDAQYGAKIICEAFENAAVDTAVSGHFGVNKLGTSIADFPRYKASELTLELGGGHEGGAVKEESGNKYLQLKAFPNGSYIRPRSNIWLTGGDPISDPGIVTLTFKARVNGSVVSGNNFEVGYVGSTERDATGTITGSTGRKNHALNDDGAWHTYETSGYVSSTETVLSAISVYAYTDGGVDVDDITYWYTLPTAPVYVYDGETLVNTKTIDTTTTHTVSSLLGNWENEDSSRIFTGVEIGGKTYGVDDTVTLAGYNEINLQFVDAIDISIFGDPVATLTFEGVSTSTELQQSTASTALNGVVGANANNAAFFIENAASTKSIVSEGDNTFYRVTHTAEARPMLTVRTSLWSDPLPTFAKEPGYLTLIFDARSSSTDRAGTYNMVRPCYGYAGGSNLADDRFSIENDGRWHTYTSTCETTDAADIASFQIYCDIIGTVDFDNIYVSWKPKTANVTFKDGETVLGTTSVSTLNPVTPVQMAQDLELADRTKSVVGIVLDGETYGANDLIYLTKDIEVQATLGDNPNYDPVYGFAALTMNFDNLANGRPYTEYHWALDTILGAYIDTDVLNLGAGRYNLTAPSNGANLAVTSDGANKYLSVTGTGHDMHFSLYSTNNPITAMYNWAWGPAGTYTLQFDTKLVSGSVADAASGQYNHMRPTGLGQAYLSDADYNFKINTSTWTTHTVSTTDKEIGGYQFRQVLNGTVGFDNIKLFYKPSTVEVTLVKDGVQVAKQNVTTAGIKVSDLCNLITLDDVTKAIAGINYNGTDYAMNDTLVLTHDTTIEVNVGDNENYSPYGSIVLWYNLNSNTDADGGYVRGADLGMINGSAILDANLGGNWSNYTYAKVDSGAKDGSAYVTLSRAAAGYKNFTVQGLAPQWQHPMTDEPGVYTFQMDAKFNTVPDGASPFFVRMYESNSDPASGTNAGVISSNYNQINLVPSTEWTTYTAIQDTTVANGNITTPWTLGMGQIDIYTQHTTTDNITMSIDNIKLFTKPSTAQVTLVDADGNNYGTTTVSTAGVSLSELTKDVELYATQICTGVTIAGVTYGPTDNIVIGGNLTATIEIGKNENYDLKKGIVVAYSNFQNPAKTTFAYHASLTRDLGGVIADASVITLPGEALNFTSPNNNAGASIASEGTNKYLQISGSNGYGKFLDFYTTDWPITAMYNNPIGADGTYTFEFDQKLISGSVLDADNTSTHNHWRVTTKAQSTILDVNDVKLTDTWETFSVSAESTAETPITGIQLRQVFGSASVFGIDNFKIWYKPAQANITTTVEGKEYTFSAPTDGSTVAEIIAQSGLVLDNPYKQITGFIFDGTTYNSDDAFYFAGNIHVEAVVTDNEKLSQDAGKTAYTIDFNAMTGAVTNQWAKASEYGATVEGDAITYSGTNLGFIATNSYFTARDKATGNDGTSAVEFTLAGGADNYFTINYQEPNWQNEMLPLGIYTVEFEAKFSAKPTKIAARWMQTGEPSSSTVWGLGASGHYGNVEWATSEVNANEWTTFKASFDNRILNDASQVFNASHTTTATNWNKNAWTKGLGQMFIDFAGTAGDKVTVDNVKISYKPYTADVTFKYTDVDGAVQTVADTKEVSTTGVTAASLVEGVKVRGYEIKSVTYAGKTYAIDSADAIVFAQKQEIVYLTVEKLPVSEFAPETNTDVAGVRTDDPTGLRFSATMLTADDSVQQAGWVVTRQALLTNAGVAVEDFGLNSEVKKVTGYNIDTDGTEKIFATENNIDTFTAVLTGITAANYDDVIVAKPFVIDYDTWYGEAYVGTYRQAAQKILDSGASLTAYQRALLESIVNA